MNLNKYTEDEKLKILEALSPVADIPSNIIELEMDPDAYIDRETGLSSEVLAVSFNISLDDLPLLMTEEDVRSFFKVGVINRYASDRDPEQLEIRNAALRSYGISIPEGSISWEDMRKYASIPEAIANISKLRLEIGDR